MKNIHFWSSISLIALLVAGLLVIGTGITLAQQNEAATGIIQEPANPPPTEQDAAGRVAIAAAEASADRAMAISFAAALTVALSCCAAGYAVAKVGAAAMGAASEKPELLGRALIFVGLAEGIAIYGLIIGVLLILKL